MLHFAGNLTLISYIYKAQIDMLYMRG